MTPSTNYELLTVLDEAISVMRVSIECATRDGPEAGIDNLAEYFAEVVAVDEKLRRILDAWEAAKSRRAWVAVEERLPDDDMTVLVFVPGESDPVWHAYFSCEDESWHYADGGTCWPSHWRELPAPPTDD